MDTKDDPAALVRAAATGDGSAWNALVERYAGLLWSIGISYRLDRADVADAFQTTWLRLVENLDRIQDPARIGSWLATTFRRECSALLRRAGRAMPMDDITLTLTVDGAVARGGAGGPGGQQPAPAPDAGLLRSERNVMVRQAYERLGDRCREVLRVLVTQAEDGPPRYAQAAEILGMPVGSLGPTRSRCLEQLRRHLGDIGIYDRDGDS